MATSFFPFLKTLIAKLPSLPSPSMENNLKPSSNFNNHSSSSFFFAPTGMKRSPSELALDEFLAFEHDNDENKFTTLPSPPPFLNHPHHLHFPHKNQETVSEFTNPLSHHQNGYLVRHRHQLPQISSTLDIKSSLWVDSSVSANNGGGNHYGIIAHSGSSDEEDQDVEAGYCDQSTEQVDEKRIKRMASNRESAQRSRIRRQKQLSELEQQVEKLRGDNDALIKQLADASQQFKDATTNNRVLKSNVEALRAKVKLAEDMVNRGCLTSSMTHLLQNYLNMPEDYINTTVINRLAPEMIIGAAAGTPGDNNTNGSSSAFGGISSDSGVVGLEIERANDGDVVGGNLPDIWNLYSPASTK